MSKNHHFKQLQVVLCGGFEEEEENRNSPKGIKNIFTQKRKRID